MSAETPKIEASAQGEQHTQNQDDQASITSKPGQDNNNNNNNNNNNDENNTAAGDEKPAKPNPLKKLGAVFKTVFACLRKPAVRSEDDAAAAAASKAQDRDAAAGDEDEEDALKKGADAAAAESHAPVSSQAPVIEQGVLSGQKEGAPHS
ncbi:hypothetical protein B0I37DRAFT_358282 [Chaetomium sp. MPI-CAGE-AT-0009]|nr:hypothetical protein B0I37DRAFT_358282 [Chaetomium sp. MPI-CAGE-AT-0009]